MFGLFSKYLVIFEISDYILYRSACSLQTHKICYSSSWFLFFIFAQQISLYFPWSCLEELWFYRLYSKFFVRVVYIELYAANVAANCLKSLKPYHLLDSPTHLWDDYCSNLSKSYLIKWFRHTFQSCWKRFQICCE